MSAPADNAHAGQAAAVEHRHDLHALGELVGILAQTIDRSAAARPSARAFDRGCRSRLRRSRRQSLCRRVRCARRPATAGARCRRAARFRSRVSVSVSSTPSCSRIDVIGIDARDLDAAGDRIAGAVGLLAALAVADDRDAGRGIAIGERAAQDHRKCRRRRPGPDRPRAGVLPKRCHLAIDCARRRARSPRPTRVRGAIEPASPRGTSSQTSRTSEPEREPRRAAHSWRAPRSSNERRSILAKSPRHVPDPRDRSIRREA